MKVGAAARLLRALEEEKRFSESEFFWKIEHEEAYWRATQGYSLYGL